MANRDCQVFHICPAREAIQNMSEWCLTWDCMLLCLLSKAHKLHSASPPVYEHYGALHCGTSLPIYLDLPASCWATSRHFSNVTAPKAGPLHYISSLSMALFFIHSSTLTAFIFIACVHTQLSHTWFKCISVGDKSSEPTVDLSLAIREEWGTDTMCSCSVGWIESMFGLMVLGGFRAA